MLNSIDNRQNTIGVFLSFAKAFDNHEILLGNLSITEQEVPPYSPRREEGFADDDDDDDDGIGGTVKD